MAQNQNTTNVFTTVQQRAVRESRRGDYRDGASGTNFDTSGDTGSETISRTGENGEDMLPFVLGLDTLGDEDRYLRVVEDDTGIIVEAE